MENETIITDEDEKLEEIVSRLMKETGSVHRLQAADRDRALGVPPLHTSRTDIKDLLGPRLDHFFS